MDSGESIRNAFNCDGQLVRVGCMKGVRFLFGWGEWDSMKGFAFYSRRLERNASAATEKDARIGQVYQFDNCWIYCFNGPIRHRVPQAKRSIKFYHRGSSSGGACVNFIMTMTCDVNEVEVKWIMRQIAHFMFKVEGLFKSV